MAWSKHAIKILAVNCEKPTCVYYMTTIVGSLNRRHMHIIYAGCFPLVAQHGECHYGTR